MDNDYYGEYNASANSIADYIDNWGWANSFGGDLFGFSGRYKDALNLATTHMQNAFNSAEAQRSRDWQQYMSNTANQRAVADLKEAGFSPLALMGNTSSASTPSGSSASGADAPRAASSGGSVVSSIIGSALKAIVGLGISSANNEAKAQLNSENIASREKIAESVNQNRKDIASSYNDVKKDINNSSTALKRDISASSNALKRELSSSSISSREKIANEKIKANRVLNSQRIKSANSIQKDKNWNHFNSKSFNDNSGFSTDDYYSRHFYNKKIKIK